MEGLVVPALLVSLSAGAFWFVRRQRRREAAGRQVTPVATPAPMPAPPVAAQLAQMRPLLCPTCNGQYPPGLRFCPLDARALVQNSEWSMGTVLQVVCRGCHRAFEPTTRFCPYDAQELEPAASNLPLAIVVAQQGPPGGRICPRCNDRYGGTETFCGRDGSELVTLN
jgi:predicted amidophosphoribosyltransferase